MEGRYASHLFDIAAAAQALADGVRKFHPTTVRRPLCESIGEVHRRLDRLDYLLRGRTAADYARDREAWERLGWPFSPARWIVGAPGPLDDPIVEQQAVRRVGDDFPYARGWPPDVALHLFGIHRMAAAIKCATGHLPVFSLGVWRGGEQEWWRENAVRPARPVPWMSDAAIAGAQSRWFDSVMWRQINYGVDFPPGYAKQYRDQANPSRQHDISEAGGLDVIRERGIPVEWLDRLAEEATDLLAVVKSFAPTAPPSTEPEPLTPNKMLLELFPDRFPDYASLKRFLDSHPEIKRETNGRRSAADANGVAAAIRAEARKPTDEEIDAYMDGIESRKRDLAKPTRK